MIARVKELKYFLVGQTRLIGGRYLQVVEDALGIRIPFTRFFMHSQSYFFRDIDEFEEPFVRAHAQAKRELSVLCVGCARGQEPYTIAILCDEHHIPVRVTAVDRNPHAIGIAREAVYDLEREKINARNARGETPALRIEAHRRYFEDTPAGSRVRADIRERVSVSVMDAGDLPFEAEFDFVFCRNMLYYLPVPKREDVIRRLKRALKPGLDIDRIVTDPITRRKRFF
jgi:chemotaxis protein methyltransferase CheR